MAGHNSSGNTSSLWQALFAAFIQFFTRIFHSNSSKDDSSSHQQARPSPGVPGGDLSNRQTTPAIDAGSRHTSASQLNQPLDSNPDLEKGQQHQEDGAMAAVKKCDGNKRPSLKPNGAQPVTANASTDQQRDKENIGPSNQINPSSAPSGSSDLNKAPHGASNHFSTPDAREHALQGKPQKPTDPMTSTKNLGGSLSTMQIGNATKNDGPTSGREAPKVAGNQTPVITAVVPAENGIEIQKAGSYSQTGAQTPDFAPKPATTSNENGNVPAADAHVKETTAAVGRLVLDDNTPGPEKALTKDTAAIEAAGVPLIVVNAVPGQPSVALKPLAPLVTPPSQVLPGLIEPETEEGKRERAIHLDFMREALKMGDSALSINETPVGCVLVYKNRIIAKGMNATNITRNGTRHAEFMALSALLSHQEDVDVKDADNHDESLWGDVDPSDGHIFPYGQKLHPSPKVDRSIISECILYVTVEPCVMCASLLRQLRIKKVYFGAVNDKFGGTGGVFRVHVNSTPVARADSGRPYQNGYGPQDAKNILRGKLAVLPRTDEDGDGGNVEPGYPAEGGYLRDEAVSLLRRFYVQENGRAPQPRKKEGRAARLFAMENAAANGGVLMDPNGNILGELPAEGEVAPVNGNSTPVLAT